ncbi:glycosyltransferase [Luteolibacter sp. LG18]|uniref:glycosyltransferase family 32 protein n=1 Tax=Luteolibacter sp. LG18 TaxID=2819286 RepID=UPI002B2D7518|nr:hypothetical protein llg_40130 [Luteolibacter sp. LG18]
MIPRRFIQTHSSELALTPLHRDCQESLRSHHPGFEYLFFSDAACRKFIEQRNPGFLPLWDYYPKGVQRSDFFRILAIYELGGFYADMDVFFHDSVEDLLSHSLVFPVEWQMPHSLYVERHREEPVEDTDLYQYGNYAFGAEPGHWFFREILEEMIRRTALVDMQDLQDNDILYSTGPDVVNSTYRKFRDRAAPVIHGLLGEASPRPPQPVKAWGDPEWFQFGRYGNHLMTSVWRGKRS